MTDITLLNSFVSFQVILVVSIHLISADDCNKCKTTGTNRFACTGYNSFQFCSGGKIFGNTLSCGSEQVCSWKGESPCVNATDSNPSTCRRVCTKTCGNGDLYTCTSPDTFQICATNPPIKKITCPNGQYCTDKFCQPTKVDGIATVSSCSSDITVIDFKTFCDKKQSGKYLDPNDENCMKVIECKYNADDDKLIGDNATPCNTGEQFNEKFGQCLKKRQDGCPPLSTEWGAKRNYPFLYLNVLSSKYKFD